jgi:hypothetical protein
MKCEVNFNIAKAVLLSVLLTSAAAGASKKHDKLDKLSRTVEKLGKRLPETGF